MSTVVDVFGRLLDEVDVPGDDRSAMLAQLNSLKARYPNDTPAHLLYRAPGGLGDPAVARGCPERRRT